jgi:hypothetical protein
VSETISQAVIGGGQQQAPSNPERAANKAAFDEKVAQIRNHPDLSDEAKRRYLAEAWEEAQSKDQEILASQEAAEQQEVEKLERDVFSVPMPLGATTGEKIATTQSYRDASFRVLDRLDATDVAERPQVLEDLMERAHRTGDKVLELACYHEAVARGIWSVSNAYRAKNEDAAKK